MEKFDFFIIVVVVGCGLVDWLMGPTIRKRIRESLEEFWIRLEDAPFRGLPARDAHIVVRGVHRIYGMHLFSVRSYGTALLISTAVLWLIIVYLLGPQGLSEYGPHKDIFIMLCFIYPVNAALDLISIFFTVFFLSKIIIKDTIMRIFGYLLLDVVVGITLCTIPIITLGIINAVDVWIWGADLDFIISEFCGVFAVFAGERAERAFYIALCVSPIFPTLIHMFLMIVLAALRVMSPLIKAPMSLIMLRLSESPKGVIFTIGCGVGAIAKIVHAFVKAF